jgi:hypothetical protein
MKLVQAAQAQSLRDTSSFMQGVGSVLQFVGAAVDEEFGPIIAAVGTGVSKAGTILSAFNQFIHPDSSVADVAIINLQIEITQLIAEVENEIKETSELGRMQDVDIAFTLVSNEFDNLQANIGTTDSGIIYTSLTNCLAGIRALRNEDLWKITWISQLAYTDSWDGNAIPPADQTVFSYVYILPKFMQAIGMFLTVIAALEPSALEPSGLCYNELLACLATLQDVDDKMTKVQGTPWGAGTVSGIIGTRLPSLADVAHLTPTDYGIERWDPAWQALDPVMWPFGAVEPYSGVNNVDSYWPYMVYHKVWPDSLPASFLSLVNLRIENQKKSLYAQLGFPAVRHTIRLLQAVTGQPVPARPYTDSCGNPLPMYDTWSLRCAFSMLGVSSGSLKGFWDFLRTIPPYSGGMEVPEATNFPPVPLSKSFRALFTPPSY